jgi:hypothetical protein
MNREDLLALCRLYVRRRGLVAADPQVEAEPPARQIVDSYRQAEITANERDSLIAFVRGVDPRHEDDVDASAFEDLDVDTLHPEPEIDPDVLELEYHARGNRR